MLKNYLLTTYRHLASQKGYGLINITGLAIGMAAVVLIGIYIRAHLRFDRFHEKADRICEVLMETHSSGNDRHVSDGTDGPLAATLEADYPKIEEAVRISRQFLWLQYEARVFSHGGLVVEPEFFDIFDFATVNGDPKTALQDAYTILLTEETAKKLIPDADPIGKIVSLDGLDQKGDYTVTGILKNPKYSSLRFDFITTTTSPGILKDRMDHWILGAQHRPFSAWVLLREGVDPKDLEPKIQSVLSHLGPTQAKKVTYHLSPLTRQHLYWGRDYTSQGVGQIDTLITYVIIAGFILAIACVNYINLMTARASRRSQEIGLRKVVGANRRQLIGEFLGESNLTSLASLLLGFVFSLLYFTEFAALTGWSDLELIIDGPLVFVLGAFVGLLSGLYPAFYLTRIDPAVVMKGEDTFTHTRSLGRRALVVAQFTASIAIIVGTFAVRDQIQFASTRDLGYRWKNVIEIPILWISRQVEDTHEQALTYRYPAAMNAFLQHPNITDAAATRFPQGQYVSKALHVAEGSTDEWSFGIQDTDPNFFAFNEIEILAGRPCQIQTKTLDTGETIQIGRRFEEYVLNAKAVDLLGWKTDDPNPYEATIGKRICGKGNPLGTLVGVCENYHTRSLHTPIDPIAFNANPQALKFVQLALAPGNRAETFDFIKQTWKRFLPNHAFEHVPLEAVVEEWNLWAEHRLSDILDVAATLAIFVSCLGLLGLVSFLAETKMREIGIRKVLGAGTGIIIRHLTSDFAKLILIANLIALPIAWWLIDDWLNSFAFRMEMGIGVFVLTGVLAFVAAGVMIGYHTYRAASREPGAGGHDPEMRQNRVSNVQHW